MKFCIINIFCLLSVTFAFAETGLDTNKIYKDSSLVLPDVFVNKIIIVGNDVTDVDIITRELYTKENSKLNYQDLEKDIERLYNLGLFNKVDVYPAPTDSVDKVDLVILVEERFYIIPLPQGGFRNGEFSKFWAGLNVVWNNFRGRNERASLSFGIGYEPFVGLSYSVPWIGKKAHFFSSASVNYSKNFNQSLEALNDTTSNTIPSSANNFAIFNFNAAYSLGKFFTKNFSLASSVRYNIIHSSQYEPGRTVSPDGKDNYLTLLFSGRFDTRNSQEYTLSGSYYFLEYTKFGFGKLFDFNRVNFNARKFIPIKVFKNYNFTFASMGFGAISFGGTIPYYLKEYFGYGKIIRGYKQIVFEGENQLGVFSEFRLPIINPFYFKGESVPVVKSISMLKNMSYKFGLYLTLFFDVGGVWNKNSNFFNTQFYNGFGSGLNFILPFGFVGRTDFAFRVEGKRFVPQVIVDLDAAF